MNRFGLTVKWLIALWACIMGMDGLMASQMTDANANAQQMLQLVNAIRIQNNIRPLCLSEKLVRAAAAHSSYQGSINVMTHDGPVSLGDRFIRQGYQPAAVAENVGFTSTPFTQVVFDIWMSSPEHRANILDPNYVHFGSANSVGSNSMYFWTQLFATPMNTNLEPCDFNAAKAAAGYGPGQVNFAANGAWGTGSPGGSPGMVNYNNYSPGMNPNANCVAVDNGSGGGKSLNCRVGSGPNGGYSAPGPYGQMGPAPNYPSPMTNPLGPNYINNPTGYPGTSCQVINVAPAPDGHGSVKTLKCDSTNAAANSVGTPHDNPSASAPPTVYNAANPVIINSDAANPNGYNPQGPAGGVGYNAPGPAGGVGYNPPGPAGGVGYNPQGSYGGPVSNPPGYNPPGPAGGVGYNPSGYNPQGSYGGPANNYPGYNPQGPTGGAGYNPVGPDGGVGSAYNNPPGPAGGVGYNSLGSYGSQANNPPGYNPPGPAGGIGYNPPGYSPQGPYGSQANNPPGYNPQGPYGGPVNNPPGYNPPGNNGPNGYSSFWNPPGQATGSIAA